MDKSTTTKLDEEAADKWLDLLEDINPRQTEQFEAVLSALIEAKFGKPIKPALFDKDGDDEYTDGMVSLFFEVWMNAKINLISDIDQRHREIEAVNAAMKSTGPSKTTH